MKHLPQFFFTFTMITLLLTPTLMADRGRPRDPGVKRREYRQERRIRKGVRSGELTKDEAQTLKKEQRDIHRKERRMKADGELTPEERKELHQDLNKANKDIYQEKHDAEKR